MRKKWLRLMRIAPLALLFAGVASAQTTGNIIGVVTDFSTGKPVAGAVIIATSPALQGEQTAVTDQNGNYQFRLLPPGEYKLAVQLDGYKPAERSDITLRLDKTIRANLSVVPEAVQMEEQVVRTGAAPAVNIGAAESGAVVSREFVASIPVGRTVEQASAVVPQAGADTYGVGFAGAQSPENAYILDGMNVTDPVYGTFGGNTYFAGAGLAQPSLLTNFMQEIDVKTGGFMPEYGRATGGILNMVTRSGSNEFHGSVFSTFTPRFLVQPTGEIAGAVGEAVAWRNKPGEGAYDLDAGFEVGGPIQKDKLWFYGGFAPVITKRTTERFLRSNVLADASNASQCVGQDLSGLGRCIDAKGNYVQNVIPGTSQIVDSGRTSYQFVGKLTYLLDENNNLTLSGFGTPSTANIYRMNSTDSQRTLDSTDSIYDVIGHYAGKFMDKRLIVEATGGWHRSSSVEDPTAYQRANSMLSYRGNYGITDFQTYAGGGVADRSAIAAFNSGACGTNSVAQCTVNNYSTGGWDYLNNQLSNRLAGRLSGSYLFDAVGAHNTKVGLDVERSTYRIEKTYGGSAWYYVYPDLNRISIHRGYGTTTNHAFVNDVADISAHGLRNNSATNSTAVFAQDGWQLPAANVTLNYGVRWEAQHMSNLDNPADNGFTISNNWAPRVQGIWDFTGSGRGKVAGSWGRFFYMMPLDMGDRAFGNETSLAYRLNTANCGLPTAGAGAATLNPASINPSSCGYARRAAGVAGSSDPWIALEQAGGTPVSPDLQATYVDQFGAQAEYELLSDFTVGFEYSGRRQGNVIEDMSNDDGTHYFIANPGYGKPFPIPGGGTFDPRNVTAFDTVTGRNINVVMPKPERSYDGFTVFTRKSFSQGWQASASYTLSYLRGNLAGPYRQEDGQIDPGITSEYDLATLMNNRNGFLPGDQRHVVKVFGSYTWNFGPRFNVTTGAGYTATSGNPVNVLGAHPLYGPGQAFIIPRGQAGRSPFLNEVDLKGMLNYVIKAPYQIGFSVDVFNLFNSQQVRLIDEDYTFDDVQPISGLKCDANAVGGGSPVQKLQSACPQLKYLKTTDGRPVTVNSNWGRAATGTSSFQVPLYVRFGVALSF